MSQALYRKWRPARFDQVVGQQHVTQTLKNAVAADRIGHAYLFSGPRGTGKTTTARLLAKAANCLDPSLAERPCDRCAPCIAVNEGRFLDLIEIDAASNTGVDDIRDLRDKINFSPSEGQFKVYIIDEVHMLSTAAFNALLKTLEEPPPHAIFVLATTEEHKVPLTIKSRCQLFNFRLLTTQEIMDRLNWLAGQEDLTVEPSAVQLIALHGAGSLRDAESLLDQLVAAPGDQITLQRAQMVLGTASDEAVELLTDAWLAGDGSTGLTVIHEALASGADARQFARQMVTYLRQLLLLQTAGRELPLNISAEQQAALAEKARRADRQLLIAAVKSFNQAATTSTGSWQPQLPLELAFIELLPAVQRAPVMAAPPPAQPAQAAPVAATAPAEEREPASVSQEPLVVLKPVGKPPVAAPPVEKTPVAAPVGPPPTAETAALTLAEVKAQWLAIREPIGQQDRNLPALLDTCKPLAVEGRIIVLGFDYPILKEKFDNRQGARELVAQLFSRLFGETCQVRTVVADQYVAPAPISQVDAAEFTALAQELGGIVVEDE